MENGTLQSQHIGGGASLIHSEKFKVAAEIEDVEFLFVFAVEQAWTQASAATDHLPELGLAQNFLEKHEVKHLRYVDAGIKHIH